MTTSKPRVRAYVDHDTYAKLQFATTRPHVSISDTVNNALFPKNIAWSGIVLSCEGWTA